MDCQSYTKYRPNETRRNDTEVPKTTPTEQKATGKTQ